jgi:hypothetical protein
MEDHLKEQEIDQIASTFRRTQTLGRIIFVILLVAVFAGIMAVLYRSEKKVDVARQEMTLATTNATDIKDISNKLLSQVKSLDAQAAKVANNDNPTLAVWSGGLPLPPVKTRSKESDGIEVGLLNSRRYLMGSITHGMLAASSDLKDYACEHKYYVVGASPPSATADQWLKQQTDQRFALTALMASPKTNSKALVVGWFLNKNEANGLIQEINSHNHNGSFRETWDYGGTDCSAYGN